VAARPAPSGDVPDHRRPRGHGPSWRCRSGGHDRNSGHRRHGHAPPRGPPAAWPRPCPPVRPPVHNGRTGGRPPVGDGQAGGCPGGHHDPHRTVGPASPEPLRRTGTRQPRIAARPGAEYHRKTRLQVSHSYCGGDPGCPIRHLPTLFNAAVTDARAALRGARRGTRAAPVPHREPSARVPHPGSEPSGRSAPPGAVQARRADRPDEPGACRSGGGWMTFEWTARGDYLLPCGAEGIDSCHWRWCAGQRGCAYA
jgi:hypothetical protein